MLNDSGIVYVTLREIAPKSPNLKTPFHRLSLITCSHCECPEKPGSRRNCFGARYGLRGRLQLRPNLLRLRSVPRCHYPVERRRRPDWGYCMLSTGKHPENCVPDQVQSQGILSTGHDIGFESTTEGMMYEIFWCKVLKSKIWSFISAQCGLAQFCVNKSKDFDNISLNTFFADFQRGPQTQSVLTCLACVQYLLLNLLWITEIHMFKDISA